MQIVAGLASIGTAVVCFGLLFVLVCVGLVLWYWRHEPNKEAVSTASTPPVATKVETPQAAEQRTTPVPAAPVAPVSTPVEPATPAPAEPVTPAPPAPPSWPPSADA